MSLRYLPRRLLTGPRPDVPALWRSARDLFESVMTSLTSARRLARVATLQKHHRQYLQAVITPVEMLVRSLLMSEAVAWLTSTDEGMKVLSEEAARRDSPAAPQAPRTTIAAAANTETDADTPATDGDASPSHTTTDADIERALDPRRLRFLLAEPQKLPWTEPRAATPRTAPKTGPRPNAGLRFARRIEALRLILADPMPMIRILARYLARRNMPPIDVPTPFAPIRDHGWPGVRDILLARAISFARMVFLHDYKLCRDRLALPPPQPG